MENRPVRKKNRLEALNYCRDGAYFVTICTEAKRHMLWETSVGALTERPQGQFRLSKTGRIVEQTIQNIPCIYPGVLLEHYVVMPNHVHLLLLFQQEQMTDSGRSVSAPTELATVIRHLKGFVTRRVGKNIWQKGYYDHIVRNEFEYQQIWCYIDQNPSTWLNDDYYEPTGGIQNVDDHYANI